ncbi:GNAT family N-acetyltransferase [Sinimarinibacterium sp. CAU 1509]|uniref:GNAT family N-acetyltransferase n=1 Tax=Sinimarinibacterium sp. CAU 1509 TaxID=2562283 RepID=UPI0010ACAF4B|nr:GNAT family N-acetyltransferase [Sinimarinibacterium sp. CAU 1509]TJY57157.1 GNAT family N-acetyltransferase [Sinimarinibacterium sp. CAU 1509]
MFTRDLLHDGVWTTARDNADPPVGIHASMRTDSAWLDLKLLFPSSALLDTRCNPIEQIEHWATLNARPLGQPRYRVARLEDLQNRGCRSQGVGTLLLNTCLTILGALCDPTARVWGELSPESGEARRRAFYEAYGFKVQEPGCTPSNVGRFPRIEGNLAALRIPPPNPNRRFSIRLPSPDLWQTGPSTKVEENLMKQLTQNAVDGRLTTADVRHLRHVETQRFPFSRGAG